MATNTEHAMARAFARKQAKLTGKAQVILDHNKVAKFPKGRHALDVQPIDQYQTWYRPENVVAIVAPRDRRAA